MKLMRLDNGDWIDPETVRIVKPLQMIMDEYGFHPPRVVIVHSATGGREGHSVIELSEGADIQLYADHLAEQINCERN